MGLKMRIIPLEEFSQDMPCRGTIVDVGCGYGYITNYLSLDSSDRMVIGIDPSHERIEFCQKTVGRRGNIKFIAEDIQQVNIPSADGVIMADVLHHIPYSQHRQVLDKIHAILKKDGTFLMRETKKAGNIRYVLFNYLMECVLYPRSEKLNFRSDSEWIDTLEKSGFRIIRTISNQGSFPYMCTSFVCHRA